MKIALWIVQGLLAFAFIASGLMKTFSPLDELLANGMGFVAHFPGWFVRFIGIAEVAGGVGLILPALLRIKPLLTPLAAALLAFIMLGAVGTHLWLGDPGTVAPLVLALLSGFVAWGRVKKVPIAARA